MTAIQPRAQRLVALWCFAVLLVALIVEGGGPRLLGDSAEYVGLAKAILAGDEHSLASAVHFWMYPLLASPFAAVARSVGMNESAGFVLVNVSLLMLAFWVLSQRISIEAASLVVAGPVLWWVDKPHTEVFTVALLSIALALRRSGWSPVAVGLASTQNPPIALLFPLLLADRCWKRGQAHQHEVAGRFTPGAWVGLGIGCLLGLLPLLYFRYNRGIINPLLASTQLETPTFREVAVVISDPNLGLLCGYPVLPIFAAIAVGVLCKRVGSRRCLPSLLLPAAAAAGFLWAFAHTTNFNHGATPGMSRYALWLIPLAVPLLEELRETDHRPAQRWLLALTVASVAWSLLFFRPALPEGLGTPSFAARVLWNRYPALNEPLPEIFVERTLGREAALLPVAAPSCAKVLVVGGEHRADWPMPCPPAPVPQECTRPGALCYGNRYGRRFSWVPVEPRSYHAFQTGNDAWPPAAERHVSALLAEGPWYQAETVRTGQSRSMVRAAHRVRRTHVLQGPDRLFVCVIQPAAQAVLDLRVPVPMEGRLVDLRTGEGLSPVALDGGFRLQSLVLPSSADVLGLVVYRVAQ